MILSSYILLEKKPPQLRSGNFRYENEIVKLLLIKYKKSYFKTT